MRREELEANIPNWRLVLLALGLPSISLSGRHGPSPLCGQLEETAERLGIAYKTARNMKYVSENLSLRKDKLKWEHHRHVAPLDFGNLPSPPWFDKLGYSISQERSDRDARQRTQGSQERRAACG